MKTKAKATEVFEVRLWSTKHFNEKLLKDTNIFRGMVTDVKTKKAVWFATATGLLTFIEKQYRQANKGGLK